ncbi:hypothetical protein [Prochlorococcus sp. MIT 1313]
MTIRPDANGATRQEHCRQSIAAFCQALRATLMADSQLLEAMERDVSREVERPTPPSLGFGFNQISYDWLSIVASFNKNNRIKHGDNQFIFLDLVKKIEPRIGLIIDT